VLLPEFPYTAAPFGAAFAGTLSVTPGACAALIADLATEVTRHGFAALVIANAHLDPTHLGALAEAQRIAGAVLGYMTKMGVSSTIVEAMSETRDIRWLSPKQALAMNLVTDPLGKP